jgi:hypothetical protein
MEKWPQYRQLHRSKFEFVVAVRNIIRYEKEARWEMQCLNICSTINEMNLPAAAGLNWYVYPLEIFAPF